jgi:hypothetical protein
VEPKPSFIQGVFSFDGKGLSNPTPLEPSARYAVPADKRAQLVYLRGGNASDELVTLSLVRDGKLMRLFPLGAKGAVHVPLAVVEDIFPESKLEVLVSAPSGLRGFVVLDLGILEIA